MNTWHSDLERSPMSPASPKHYELLESTWRHDERLNNYKMDIHIQVVCVIECGRYRCLVCDSVKSEGLFIAKDDTN